MKEGATHPALHRADFASAVTARDRWHEVARVAYHTGGTVGSPSSVRKGAEQGEVHDEEDLARPRHARRLRYRVNRIEAGSQYAKR